MEILYLNEKSRVKFKTGYGLYDVIYIVKEQSF